MAVDAKLQRGLQVAVDRWAAELRAKRQAATDREVLRSTAQQYREEMGNGINRCQEDLDRYDNDTVFAIQTYVTPDNPGQGELFLSWALRDRPKRNMTITEPYDHFEVKTENSPRGRWIPQNCHFSSATRTWTGEYEAEPGKSPNLVARSQTTNAVKYRDQIDRLRGEKRRLAASLAEREAEWADRFTESGGSEDEPKSETDKQLETAKDLAEQLRQEKPSIDKAFDAAARKRYGKSPRNVTMEDLFEFVASAGLDFDLVKPLKRQLADVDL
jgi:hypothetical protein